MEPVEVSANQEPAEGEVLVVTIGGGFLVKGTMHEIAGKLANEDWPHFELAESGDRIIIRSSQVVALRAGTKPHRGTIGFVHRE